MLRLSRWVAVGLVVLVAAVGSYVLFGFFTDGVVAWNGVALEVSPYVE